MGERLLCKQEVIGSIPFTSTTLRLRVAGHFLWTGARSSIRSVGGPERNRALEQTSFRSALLGAIGCGGGNAVAGSLTL